MSRRCAQAVLLLALLGATLEQTAAALGVGRAIVPRLQARLRRQCAEPYAARPNSGGRRRASLSLEEERNFLEEERSFLAPGRKPRMPEESWSVSPASRVGCLW